MSDQLSMSCQYVVTVVLSGRAIFSFMKKKGRGLSYDQKRQKMLRIFHDTRSVFNYEEIEKLSIKAGIPFPSVKEIINSLKADSLIECQKIGAGVFYWSFPSKAAQIFQAKIAMSQQQTTFFKQEIATLQLSVQQAQNGRQQSDERDELLSTLRELQAEQAALKQEISKYIRFDPERVALLKKQNQELLAAANLQTDNLEQIKKFIKKTQPGVKDAEIEESYGIPADLDYLE